MSALLVATRAGVMRAVWQDGSWSVESTLGGEDVRCLAADDGAVFAGTRDRGVFRSDDNGRTWAAAGLNGQRVRSLAAGGGAVYAGTREPRIHVSVQGGRGWRPLARFPAFRSWWWVQPAEKPYRPSYVSAIAVTPRGTILAGIEACAVIRSDDGGASWSGHRRGALRDCHELHVVGGRIFEAGSGGLAVSDDDGRSWRRPRAGLDRRYGWSVAVRGDRRYLAVAPYLSAHSGDAKACVFRARGDGPWERATDELTSLPRLCVSADGDTFAALGDGTLLRSIDEGRHWDRVPVDLVAPSAALLAIE